MPSRLYSRELESAHLPSSLVDLTFTSAAVVLGSYSFSRRKQSEIDSVSIVSTSRGGSQLASERRSEPLNFIYL